jgi:hypothetical protein
MNKQYKLLLRNLKLSKNETDVFNSLKEIVKLYDYAEYKDDILSNPYFKLILTEVVDEVVFDLININKSIINKLIDINHEISNIKENSDIYHQLKLAKIECDILINEINGKISKMKSII